MTDELARILDETLEMMNGFAEDAAQAVADRMNELTERSDSEAPALTYT